MKKLITLLVLSLSLVFSISTTKTHATESGTNQLIIINKKTNKLAFYDKGKLVKQYSVATGRTRSLTPEGTFKIVNKIKNRPYYKEKIPGGSPRNPLGKRWLGIDAWGTNGTTYAIHGNANESSIGSYASSGCIRMHNAEIEELFSQVERGTTVYITHSSKSFDHLAEEKGYYLTPTIVKYDKVIILLENSKLYKAANTKAYTGASISPQQLTAIEKAGKFIKVKTHMGNYWIHTDMYIEGKSEKLNTYITTFETTIMRKAPNSKFPVEGSLKPQTLKAYEKISGWYKVDTWAGAYYIHPGKVYEGIIEPYNQKIKLNESKKIYRNLTDTNSIGILNPQEVQIFEKANSALHIRSWLGDVWIK